MDDQQHEAELRKIEAEKAELAKAAKAKLNDADIRSQRAHLAANRNASKMLAR